MSIKNKNEIAIQVSAKIVPEVSNADHIDLLNNDVVNSMLTRKDVINAAVPVAGALTVSYAEGLNTDLATATLTQSTSVTFTGLENGDVKYLKITKSAGHAITFVATTNESDSQAYIDANLTSVLYAVYQKNGVNHAKSITKSIRNTTEWFKFGADGGKTSLINGWINENNGLYYRTNSEGDLEIVGELDGNNATSHDFIIFNDTSLIPASKFTARLRLGNVEGDNGSIFGAFIKSADFKITLPASITIPKTVYFATTVLKKNA